MLSRKNKIKKVPPESEDKNEASNNVENGLDLLVVSESDCNSDSSSSGEELSESPPKKKEKQEDTLADEEVLSQRSALIKSLKDHKVCIGRLRKLARSHLIRDGKPAAVYWETWVAPPGWTDDMEKINAPPEPDEPMSPSYYLAQVMKKRPRRGTSAAEARIRREEELRSKRDVLEHTRLREATLARNKSPVTSRKKTKFNYFAKPLPTSSDEEAEEEARKAAVECGQRIKADEDEFPTGTKGDNELDLEFDDRLLVTGAQKMEDDLKIRTTTTAVSSSPKQVRWKESISHSENPEQRQGRCSSYSQNVPTRPNEKESVRRRLWQANLVPSSSNTQNCRVVETKKIETKKASEIFPALKVKNTAAMASNMTFQKSTVGDSCFPANMEDDEDGDAILSQVEIPQESDLAIKVDSNDTAKTGSTIFSPFDDEDDDDCCGPEFLQALDKLESEQL